MWSALSCTLGAQDDAWDEGLALTQVGGDCRWDVEGVARVRGEVRCARRRHVSLMPLAAT